MSENITSAPDRLRDLVDELLDEGERPSNLREVMDDTIREWLLAHQGDRPGKRREPEPRQR